MIAWVKSFFTDETKFARTMRGVIVGAGLGLNEFTNLPPFVSSVVVVLGMMITVGEKNPRGEE